MNNSNNLIKKLELLREEDFVWIIYFFIVIFAITSNYFERNYLLKKNLSDKKKFRNLNTTIFIIAFLIYFYFVLVSIDEIKNGDENKLNSFLRLAGAIYLYSDLLDYNNSSDTGLGIN